MSDPYDILIIGGGIVGAGAARDAAMRGLRTCLVEQRDFAFGTSSRSSKLVHGGLRYLEQGELSLVFEAVSERRVLMDIAPHLVVPLGFLFPVYKHSRRGVFTVNIGMWLYDGLSLFRSPKIHRNLSPDEVSREEPTLQNLDLRGAPLYYDCATDDARLTLENAIDAHARGAVLHTWTRVIGMIHDAAGRVRGVRVREAHTGEEREIAAKVVLNCTGAWTDMTRALDGQSRPLLRPTKGVHIVVDRKRLPVNTAVVCFHPEDGRVLFAIPWGDRTYIGTTDTDEPVDPALVAASSADVTYLLNAGNHYFPRAKLVPDDVLSTWAGLRPLIAATGTASSVSREHEIIVEPDGMLTIAGGKLTTYRRMARELVDRAFSLLKLSGATKGGEDPRTDQHALPGGVGWPEDDDRNRVVKLIGEAGPVSEATARLFCDTYGTRGVEVAARVAANPALGAPIIEGRPECLAQVDWAVQKELALTVCDVLIRRTQIYFRDVDQGLGVVERVADRMAELLGWTADRRLQEVMAYQEEVGRSREWRSVKPAE